MRITEKNVSTSIYLSTTLQITFDPRSFKLLYIIVYYIFVRVTFTIKTKLPPLLKILTNRLQLLMQTHIKKIKFKYEIADIPACYLYSIHFCIFKFDP